MFVNGANLTSSGRIYVSRTDPIHHYQGGLPYTADGALCIAASAPQGYNGLGFANGRVSFRNAPGPNPDPLYRMGFKFNPNGEIYLNLILPIAFYVSGWPVAANGTLCVDGTL